MKQPVDYVSAPANYEEFMDIYYKYVVNLVGAWGIHYSRQYDVAHEILIRFQEKDYLSKFDPTRTFEHNGKKYPARFKTFLGSFVELSLRGIKQRLASINSREIMWGSPNDESFDDGLGAWVEHNDNVLENIEFEEFIKAVREHLYLQSTTNVGGVRASRGDIAEALRVLRQEQGDEVIEPLRVAGNCLAGMDCLAVAKSSPAFITKRKPRSDRDRTKLAVIERLVSVSRDLPVINTATLFDAILDQTRNGNSLHVGRLAEQFQVSSVTMYKWQGILRTHVVEEMALSDWS